MRERKQKDRGFLGNDDFRSIRREEIAGDVFELWLGISRLMARVHGSQRPFETRPCDVGRPDTASTTT